MPHGLTLAVTLDMKTFLIVLIEEVADQLEFCRQGLVKSKGDAWINSDPDTPRLVIPPSENVVQI
jgi:hypothetical protein